MGDPRAAAALAYQQAFLGQLGQRQANGHPRDAQALGQFFLARQLLTVGQFAGHDLFAQELAQLVVQRRAQVTPQQPFKHLRVEQIHGQAHLLTTDNNVISI